MKQLSVHLDRIGLFVCATILAGLCALALPAVAQSHKWRRSQR